MTWQRALCCGRASMSGGVVARVWLDGELIFDGSVRTMTPRIDLTIWREWAAFPGPAPSAPTNPDRTE